MTDKDPVEEPSEEIGEAPSSDESTETVISSPKPKPRARKKAQPAKAEKQAGEEPVEAEVVIAAAEITETDNVIDATVVSAEVEPDQEPEEAEEPVASIGSEPLPSTPAVSTGQGSIQTPPPPPPPPQPLSEGEERTYAMLAHLSILLNLVTGFLGPVAALVIYFVFRERSRYVRYNAMQAFVFQLIWWLGAGFLAACLWIISSVLAVILIGCLLMPIALFVSLIPLAALVYGVIGAIQTNDHQDFKYWLIGDWVRGELTGD